MGEFLYICEYLGVTPKEFFDTDNAEPQLVEKLSRLVQKLPTDDIEALINMAERLVSK